jgi:ABC-2 type transport system ATP-binding protein
LPVRPATHRSRPSPCRRRRACDTLTLFTQDVEEGPVMADAAIELSDLTMRYGSRVALDGVALRVEQGEVFGYLGPNGAGKTTTLKILAGILRPAAGEARVLGRSVVAEPLAVKASIGYVPESGAVFEKLTPREHLSFVGRVRGLTDEETAAGIARLADRFQLTAELDRRCNELSKGTKQKVCWCAAMLHDPPVLVLDEPLSGLDVESVARVKELLRELALRGSTVFYSSHLVDVVEKVCTRIAILDRGRLRAVGTPQDVIIGAGRDTLEQAVRALTGVAPAEAPLVAQAS